MADKPIIGITNGDPCGIGPEVVAKALATGEVHPLCRPVIIGSAYAMEQAVKLIGANLSVRKVESVAGAGGDPKTIDVLDLGNLKPGDITVAKVSAACGKAVSEWNAKAQELGMAGEVQGTVMAPINSEAMRAAGVIAGGGATGGYLFLLVGPLRVVHLTDHIPMREVVDVIKKDAVLSLIELTHNSLEKWGVRQPRIGVAGLNAHAYGPEDSNEVTPAVQAAQQKGIKATGPVPPDTVFRQCAEGIYDVTVAMYHDQGHIATKVYGFNEGIVALTLGRPILGSSVAHGTAFDIAGKGIANPAGILGAMKLTASLAAGKGFPG